MAVIEAIATTYLEADAATVTFSSIPSTYEHLQLRMSLRTARTSALEVAGIQLNGDTTTTYSTHRMYGTTTSATAGAETAVARMRATGQMPTAAMPPATLYGAGVVDILDYASAVKNTTILFFSGENDSTYPYVTFGSGLWDAVAAVNAILLYPANGSAGFLRGSEFTLYGLNNA